MHAVNCMRVKINVKHVFGRLKFCCRFLPHNDKYSARIEAALVTASGIITLAGMRV